MKRMNKREPKTLRLITPLVMIDARAERVWLMQTLWDLPSRKVWSQYNQSLSHTNVITIHFVWETFMVDISEIKIDEDDWASKVGGRGVQWWRLVQAQCYSPAICLVGLQLTRICSQRLERLYVVGLWRSWDYRKLPPEKGFLWCLHSELRYSLRREFGAPLTNPRNNSLNNCLNINHCDIR